MNIGKRISLTCSMLVAFTVLLAAIALYRVDDIHAKLLSVTDQSLPSVYSMGKLAQLNRSVTGNMLLHLGIPSVRQEMEGKIASGQKQSTELLAEYRKSIATPEEQSLYETIPPGFGRLWQAWDRIRALSNAGDSAAAWDLWMRDGRPALLDLEKKLNAEMDLARSNGARNAESTAQSVNHARVWIWGLLLIALLSGGGAAFLIVRGLNRQLRHTAEELKAGARELASAAARVASSSETLARGASEQAGSLQETSASAGEIISLTRRNAENSRAAAAAMREVDQEVEQGNKTLNKMQYSMAELREYCNKISRIIKIVDQIAFQTGILALNAAVEAARAGEAGAGFAVVAEEVRSLALGSAGAAKDTAALIEGSVTRSMEGAADAERVAEVIRTVTRSTGRVKILIEEVHQSSDEQARGIEQIGRAIQRMDRTTQSAAATSQESAAGGQELSAQAEALSRVVLTLDAMVGVES